jgi:ABC-type phosphate transport system substrate-binding protein
MARPFRSWLLSLSLLTLVALPEPRVEAQTTSRQQLPQSMLLAQQVPPAFPLPESIAADTKVRIDGSSSMQVINEQLEKQFESRYSGTTVDLNSNGSLAALEALERGEIDLAALGRGLTAAERSQGFKEVAISREKIAIIIGRDNPFAGNLTFKQFAQIFRGEVTDWSQVGGTAGPIRFVDRPDSSDTRTAFQGYPVFKAAPFEAGANAAPVSEDSTKAVIESLGSDGVGYAIASQVADNSAVTIVPMHQTLPDDPRYPFSQPRVYVYKGEPSPAVQAFLGFATSPDGQAAVAQAKETEAAQAEIDRLVVSSPDGQITARASNDNQVRLEGPDGKLLATIAGLTGTIGALTFSPDGKTLAIGNTTGDVSLWSTTAPNAGQAIGAPFKVGNDGEYKLFFAEDGKALAAQLPTGTQLFDLQGQPISSAKRGIPFWWWLLPLGLLGLLLWALLRGRETSQEALVQAVTPDPEPLPNRPIPAPLEPSVPVTPVASIPEPAIPVPSIPEPAIPDKTAAPLSARVQSVIGLDREQPLIEVPPLNLPDIAAPMAATLTGGTLLGAAALASDNQQVEIEPIEAEPLAVEPVEIEPVAVQPVEAAAPEIAIPPEPELPTLPEPEPETIISVEAEPEPAITAELTNLATPITAAVAGGTLLAATLSPPAQAKPREFDIATLATVDDGLSELPDGYGDSRIVLMPRDPQWAYAYWDAPEEHKAALRAQGGRTLALRLYDVTDIDLDYQAPHSLQQYDCDELARSWYLPIPVSDRDYIAELGYITPDGHWLSLAQSAPVRIPPVYPSDWIDDQFVTVDWQQDLRGKTVATLSRPGETVAGDSPIYDHIFAQAQGTEAMRVAGSLFGSMHQVPEQAISSYILPSGVGMGAIPWASGIPNVSGLNESGIGFYSSEAPAKPRNFWLIADAELIVYGATEPDATLIIGDQVIPLSADGTFRFQMAFPDGNIDYPIRAIASDGEQTRNVHLTFDRSTPERNTNTKAEAKDEWF